MSSPHPRFGLPRRHLLSRAALLGVGASLAAACTTSDRTGPPVRYAYSDPGEEAQRLLDEAVAAVTDRTGREVRLEPTVWDAYADVLAQVLAGTDPPDLVLLTGHGDAGEYLAELARQGRLLPLDEYQPDPLDLATDLPGHALRLGQVNGAQYAVPVGLSVLTAWIDWRRAERSGLDLPDQELTWDRFFDLCVRLSQDSSDFVYGTPNLLGTWSLEVLEYWLRQRGRELFTATGQLGFEPADLTDWFTYWRELAAAGGCPGYDQRRADDPEIPWGHAGEVVISFGPVSMLNLRFPEFAPDWAWRPLPRPDAPEARPGYTYSTGGLLAIPAGAGDPAAGADLLHALVLDPLVATGLYGAVATDHGDPLLEIWHGVPPAGRVREAQADLEPPLPPAYHETVQDVLFRGDQGGEPPAPPPATAGLVRDELDFQAAEVAAGRVSIAEGVDAFFTTASALL